MEACDFRHTQIKSPSVSLSLWGKLGKILEFPSLVCMCVCMCAYVITLLQQMLKGVRFLNAQTHFLIVLSSDWFTSPGQKAHGWLLIHYRTLTYIQPSYHMHCVCPHMRQGAGFVHFYWNTQSYQA